MRKLTKMSVLACALGLLAAHPVSAASPPWVQMEQGRDAWQGAQYVYGTGEGAAISRQAYTSLTAFVLAEIARPRDSWRSMVVDPTLTRAIASCAGKLECELKQPVMTPCTADMQPAVVFDADETLILNLGAEYAAVIKGQGYNPARWELWERDGGSHLAAVPGAVDAIRLLRRNNVKVIVISNRDARSVVNPSSQEDLSRFTVDALFAAELGTFKHQGDDQDLFLALEKGDTGTFKDKRRAFVASKYCVLAMAGDQLGDFTDLFAEAKPRPRREAADAVALWGQGWFLLPNPIYGSAAAGSADVNDVFPEKYRWSDQVNP